MSAGPIKKGTDNSPEQAMGDLINDGIDSSGVAEYYSQRNGEEPFIINDIKWEYVNVNNNGKIELGVYRFGQDIAYTFDWFDKNVLHSMDETTSTVGVGGDSGTFAYDAPAGDGADFWTAGNKQNKKGGKSSKDTPIVRGGIFTENIIKVGQVYKNGVGRIKVLDIKKSANPLAKSVIAVRQWGDKPARDFNIDPKELGQWELIHENKKKVLKITEAQLKRILESHNMKSTAYPNGEMVDIDDCTKLNNNKVAQNGGCSQGAVDNVVKTHKTKGSVVAEISSVQSKLVPLLIQAIEQVDDSLGYDDFADAVGTIIKEQYGAHLIKPFMQRLHKNLGI
jgi:hypothetical protein